MKRRVGFIHTSPAALAPLAEFYRDNAPELDSNNLLDDGVLRLFARGDEREAERRLADMICACRDTYGAEMCVVTCSAVSRSMIARLADATGVPTIKIDEVLAYQAVGSGTRLGVLVTFPPTRSVIQRLLQDAAREEGRQVELTFKLIPEAYEALLGGKYERHDQLLLAGIGELAKEPVDAIVFAQVSMARLLKKLPATPMPVLSSLPASLKAIRATLESVPASASR
ncbi:MAG: hypothetical protein JNK87_05510 [Bryobacterales bacterium]|nr:hypothetical protein [Bryobacterales bacterium]